MSTVRGRPHVHPSQVSCVRACPFDLASDLVAVGGEAFIEILEQDPSSEALSFSVRSSIHIGSRVTAIAWSPASKSPLASPNAWFLELAVASSDGLIRHISVSSVQKETVSDFGSVSGHKGNINDLCFCSAGENINKYVASVGDDKTCILWDLYPIQTTEVVDGEDDNDSRAQFLSPSPAGIDHPMTPSTQHSNKNSKFSPMAYPIAFAHPLSTVSSHPANGRSIMVADAYGTVSVINWMDLESGLNTTTEVWRGHRVAEFIDPGALARSAVGSRSPWSGGASWKQNDPDMFGATYGPTWSVWKQKNMHGGKPVMSGEGFFGGGHRFRWCPTNSRLFALSTLSPLSGAAVKVFDVKFPTAPHEHIIFAKPHFVRDFDWIGSPTEDSLDSPAWMAVAVGKAVHFIAAGSAE